MVLLLSVHNLYADSVVSVADSSMDERVTPSLPTSSPKATRASSGKALV